MLISIHLVAGFKWMQDVERIYAEEHIYLKHLQDTDCENAIWREAEFLAKEYRKTPHLVGGADSGFPPFSELSFVACDVRCVGESNDVPARPPRITDAVRISTICYQFQSQLDFEKYIAGEDGRNELPVQILSNRSRSKFSVSP